MSSRWQRVGPGAGWMLAFAPLAFALSMMAVEALRRLGVQQDAAMFISFVPGCLAALVLVSLGSYAIRLSQFLLGRLYGAGRPAPATAPPPPDLEGEAGRTQFVRKPRPAYPAFAQGRGVSGWVALEMRVGRDGSITHARVLDQAPRRTFERATLWSLTRARLSPSETGEARVLITYLNPFDRSPPDWVKVRLA